MSSLRNFGIALLISLLIFSGVAYFAMGVVADLFAPDEEANVNKENQNVENYDDTIGKNDQNAIKTGRSFNLLVIGTDRDPLVYNYDERNSTKPVVPKRVKATTLLFVRFDKENRALRMTTIPSSTLVTVDYVEMSIGDAYDYKGCDYIAEKVSGLLGLKVDYTVEFSGRDFVKYCPKTEYEAPVSLEVPEYKGLKAAVFEQGEKLTGDRLYTYLHYDGFDILNIGLKDEIAEGIFLQIMVKLATNDAEGFYRQISSFRTTFTQSDVAELIEVLYTLPLFVGEQGSNQTTVQKLEFYKYGSFDQEGRFRPDEEQLVKAFAAFQ